MKNQGRQFIFKILLAFFIGVLIIFTLLILSVGISQRSVPEVDHYFVKNGDHYVTHYNRMVRQQYSVVKGQNTFRIFVLGGSQAMGTPYVHQDVFVRFNFFGIPEGGGISTWIQEYFNNIYPGKKIEVVNAAVGGEDIRTATRVYKEVVQFGSPDLIIFLSGNNEFFRYYESEASYPSSNTTYDIKLDSLTTSYSQHLSSAVALCDSFKANTYFLTVPTNIRDWYPKSNGSIDEDAFESLLTQSKNQLIIDRLTGEHNNALAYFYLGKAYDNLGQHQQAYKYYVQAKDHDYRFIRTHSNFNNSVRSIAGSSEYIRTLDMEKIFRKHSKDGIPGYDLFHDWCHMKLETNQIVAKEIAKYYKETNEIIGELNDIELADNYKTKIRLLYYIKKLKWLRIKLFSHGEILGKENVDNVEDEYN